MRQAEEEHTLHADESSDVSSSSSESFMAQQMNLQEALVNFQYQNPQGQDAGKYIQPRNVVLKRLTDTAEQNKEKKARKKQKKIEKERQKLEQS